MADYRKKPLYDFRNKEYNVRRQCEHILNRTIQMFEYKGLPDTIPATYLELYAQRDRNCIIADVRGALYALHGQPSSELDAYYNPTKYIVAHPWLNVNKTFEIGKDCEILYNDSLHVGLLPIITKYVTAMVENELSLYLSDVNSRIVALLTATDETTKASAVQYLKDIEDGKLGVITNNAFIESMKTNPYGSSGQTMQITELIEYEQYLKGSLWAELGLRENYNMKRESISAGEAGLLNDALLPLVDNMLSMRQAFVDNVNKMFGTSISVDLNSAWKNNELENEIALKEAQEPEPKEEEELADE